MADKDYVYRSAQEVLEGTATAGEEREALSGEGEQSPYEGYADALKNYENRPDVETLEQRRARENGDFGDGRKAVEEQQAEGNGGVVTSKTATAKAPAKSDTKA